jgi:hypothetical protein
VAPPDLLALDRQRLATGGKQGNPRALVDDGAGERGDFID